MTEILGDDEFAQRFAGGTFIENYLAPANYHRFHMPWAGTLQQVTYLGNELRSVSMSAVGAYPRTYAVNERLVCRFSSKDRGDFVIVAVAALMVGGISLAGIDRVGADSEFDWADR